MMKLVQCKTLSKELKILEEGNQIDGRSTPFHPSLYSEGDLRVGGRISQSAPVYSEKIRFF